MYKGTVFLFASDGNGVGKTTTAKNFEKYLQEKVGTLYATLSQGFADYIRESGDYIVPYFLAEPRLTKKFFNLSKDKATKNELIVNQFPDIPDFFKSMTYRDLLIWLSDEIQKYAGSDVWAKQALNHIDYYRHLNNFIIIFDDWRREVEFDVLKENLPEEINIVTVYLKKDGIETIVNSYEGQLKNFDFDFIFEFNDDWSNEKELFDKLINYVKI